MKAPYVNDLCIKEMIGRPGWSLVAFMARRSIPCDHFHPEFEGVAETLDPRVSAAMIDVDENPSVTERLGVQAVPTTLLFRRGEQKGKWEGPYSRDALLRRVRKLLNGRPHASGGKP